MKKIIAVLLVILLLSPAVVASGNHVLITNIQPISPDGQLVAVHADSPAPRAWNTAPLVISDPNGGAGAISVDVILPSGTMVQPDDVWITETGSKYHTTDNCGSTNSAKATKISLEEAQLWGYAACSTCFG